jgi:hypothetical protein
MVALRFLFLRGGGVEISGRKEGGANRVLYLYMNEPRIGFVGDFNVDAASQRVRDQRLRPFNRIDE